MVAAVGGAGCRRLREARDDDDSVRVRRRQMKVMISMKMTTKEDGNGEIRSCRRRRRLSGGRFFATMMSK